MSDGRPLYVAPHWRNGAIGNAKWGGARLRDVLRACGMDVDGIVLGHKSLNGVKIVNFIAEDTDETGTPYAGVRVALQRARAGGVLRRSTTRCWRWCEGRLSQSRRQLTRGETRFSRTSPPAQFLGPSWACGAVN